MTGWRRASGRGALHAGDRKRWGVLTIGTGLGNARFTSRKDKVKDDDKAEKKQDKKDEKSEKEERQEGVRRAGLSRVHSTSRRTQRATCFSVLSRRARASRGYPRLRSFSARKTWMYRRLGFAKSLGARPGMTAEGAEVPTTPATIHRSQSARDRSSRCRNSRFSARYPAFPAQFSPLPAKSPLTPPCLPGRSSHRTRPQPDGPRPVVSAPRRGGRVVDCAALRNAA